MADVVRSGNLLRGGVRKRLNVVARVQVEVLFPHNGHNAHGDEGGHGRYAGKIDGHAARVFNTNHNRAQLVKRIEY